jgi:hypothetical protein
MDTKVTKRRSHLAALVAAAATLGLTMTLLVTPAFATHVDPQLIQGNKTCGELGDYDHEFKIQPVESGSYSDPNSTFEVEITVSDTADGQNVAFESNLGVDALFVKGGPGGNLYVYDPAATSDSGLHAPGNDQGTAVADPPWSGLSHLSFCFNDVPTETPSPTPTPTPAEETASPTPEESQAGETATPAPSTEESVQGATGTPAPSQPDTAMSPQGGPSPVPTIAFALILLAALGTLAWANVKTARSRA